MAVSIENRLSNLFSTEILFEELTTHYGDHLQQSGYNKLNPLALTKKNVVNIREKSYGLTHRSAKMLQRKSENLF